VSLTIHDNATDHAAEVVMARAQQSLPSGNGKRQLQNYCLGRVLDSTVVELRRDGYIRHSDK
jgi:hypothetical protein